MLQKDKLLKMCTAELGIGRRTDKDGGGEYIEILKKSSLKLFPPLIFNSIKSQDHGIWSHHFMGNRWGNSGNSVRIYFFKLQNH